MSVIEPLAIEPYFDLEEFMTESRESRIESETLEKLLELWAEWSRLLSVRKIESGGKSWLAIWLPEEVEKTVDDAWQTSPGRGYLLNSLAQYLSMAVVRELLPQTLEHSCAPAPIPELDYIRALSEAGLECREDGSTLKRRYAVATYYPFRGGCEICNLRSSCPKGNGGKDFATVVLPGYERGVND